MLTMTLVPVREDRPRYAVLVSYEPAPMEEFGARLQAVRREWAYLQDPRGKWRWTCVRVTVLRRVPGLRGREWPRKIDRPFDRTEEQRREAVRAVRRAVHLDPAKGQADPDWDLALQMRLDAESREAAAGTTPTSTGA